MKVSEKYIAMPIDAPSPLVGEGISTGQSDLGSVRGTLSALAMRRESLTRLRFAKPSSPTRGEGKNVATLVRQTT